MTTQPRSSATLARVRALLPVGVEVRPRVFAARHRLVLWVAALHLPGLLLVGLLRGEQVGHLLRELVLLAGLTAAAASPRLARRLRVVLATTALVACSALLVHLTGGLTESHFHFFAVVAFVTLYQSWLPYLVCLGWVLLHHGVLGVVAPESVYSHPAAIEQPALWAVIHGAFVLLASLAGLAAWRATELEHRRAESVLLAAPNPIYGVDRDGRLQFANPAFAALAGRSIDELDGADTHALLHPPSDPCGLCEVVRSGEEHHLDQLRLTVGGVERTVELWVRPVHERGEPTGSVVSVWDISERLVQQRRLQTLELHDALTGLANRSLLEDRLTQAFGGRARAGMAVVYVDLDRFKPVNDALGHRAGDDVLCVVARRLQDIARPRDTVARVGADEFVLLAAVPDATAAAQLGERVRDAVARAIPVDDGTLQLTASVGVRFTDTPTSADRLVADADLAMFAAKLRGGGQVASYDDSMRDAAGAQLGLAADLHRALANDELRLHYQPLRSLRTGRLTGFEALVRWQHPELGLLGPDRFVELAEQTGLIGPLGQWVLATAAAQLGEWRAAGGPDAADLTMAVNLSVRQLHDRDLVAAVTEQLLQHGLPPAALCLEVTETLLMQDGDGTRDMLERVRGLGVRVAIDDFGTGYSSLAKLHRLPVDQLKIDRSFVNGLAGDPERQQVVRAIMGLAAALRLDVVAEGIETSADRQVLVGLGCERGQGYGLGRPAAAGDLTLVSPEPGTVA